MTAIRLVLLGMACGLVLYTGLVVALLVAGRRSEARALAGFAADCAVMFSRLARDPVVSRGRKLVLVLLAAYLAMPFDVVPDFIPVAGQLDDALVVALGLRTILGGADPGVVRRHWPGPEESLRVVLRIAGFVAAKWGNNPIWTQQVRG